jgi:hypothetical protein
VKGNDVTLDSQVEKMLIGIKESEVKTFDMMVPDAGLTSWNYALSIPRSAQEQLAVARKERGIP